MPKDTREPPSLTSGVFGFSGGSVIDGTRDEVWNILLDFDLYPKWNPFTVKQTIVNASNKPHPDGPEIEPGKYTCVTFQLPPQVPKFLGGTGTVLCEPTWLFHAERWQILTELPDGRTKYESQEVLTGLLAYLLKFTFGSHFKAAFEAMGATLKERVEGSRNRGM